MQGMLNVCSWVDREIERAINWHWFWNYRESEIHRMSDATSLVLFSAFFKAFSEQCLHNYFSKLYISLNLMFSYKNVPIRETITDYLLIMGMLTIIWIPFRTPQALKYFPPNFQCNLMRFPTSNFLDLFFLLYYIFQDQF